MILSSFLSIITLLLSSYYYYLYFIATLLTGCAVQVIAEEDSTRTGAINVFGEPLKSCSNTGMALTGYTRTGYCVNKDDDIGSHHICIDLSSTTGGNFCTVTRQPNWCSSYMPCHENIISMTNSNKCPVQNWCVCQWAFASYVSAAGGCDYIQHVECEAVNRHALLAYERMASNSGEGMKYMDALNCIKKKCNLNGDVEANNTTYLDYKRK